MCPRKAWLFYYGLGQEDNSENVKLGRLIDENTYQREDHNLHFDNVCIDHINKNVVYEVKKSGSCDEMAVAQLKYYMYLLKQKGFENMRGYILIPLERKREEVYFEKDDVVAIENMLEQICRLLDGTCPVETEPRGFCKKCAYYEFCFI